MNSQSGRLVLNQLALWLVLVVVVALLTLLFSLLGAISCSVLVGVMMGATRRWRWQAIPISVVFPAVVIALSRVSKTDLAWRQTILLALLCFGVFWATYLLTFLLMFLERGAESPVADKSPPEAASCGSAKPALAECGLEEFRGQWLSETTAPDGHRQKKIMEIAADEFSMSVTTPDGQRRLLARGNVKWIGVGQPKALVISGSEGDSTPGDH